MRCNSEIRPALRFAPAQDVIGAFEETPVTPELLWDGGRRGGRRSGNAEAEGGQNGFAEHQCLFLGALLKPVRHSAIGVVIGWRLFRLVHERDEIAGQERGAYPES